MSQDTNDPDNTAALTLGEIICSGGLGLAGYFVGEIMFAASPGPMPFIGSVLSAVVGSLAGYFIGNLLRGNEKL